MPARRNIDGIEKVREYVSRKCENIRIYSVDENNERMASASCSYANAWLKKHRKSYSDIISVDINDADTAYKTDGRH